MDDSRTPEQGSPSSWPFVLLALALFGVAMAAWRPTPAGVWHDDGVYMMIGKSLAQGDGLTYGGVVGSPPAAKFPPLYPGILAGLWLLTGGIGAVTLIAVVLNLLMIAASGALLAWALHVHARLELRVALAAGLLAFMSADVLRVALIPLSESLFILLLTGCLAAWGAAERERDANVVPLAALLVALVLSRTAGAAVVLAFGVALLLRGGVRRAAIVIAPAVVAMGIWGAWASRQAESIPEGLRDVLGPYLGWLLGQIASAPGAFAMRLPGHAADVAERVAVLALPGFGGFWLWLGALVMLPYALAGGRRLHRDFPPLTLTVLAYLALLLVWPYVDRRLVSPLHPLTLALVVVGALEASTRLRPGRVRAVAVGVAVAWAGWYSVSSAGRIARGWPVSAYQIRAAALATALETLETTAPPEAVVGAPELWPAIHLHGGWTVVPSALFAPAATSDAGPIWGTAREQIDVWAAAGVDHLVLEQGGQIHGEALDTLEARCPGSVTILARMPPQMLVRISRERCSDGA